MEQATVQALIHFFSHQSPGLVLFVLLVALGSPIGITIIILLAWISHERKQNALITTYRDDMQQVLESYGKDIAKLSTFYEENVKLVVSWQKIAEGFQTTVVLNTQTMQRMCDLVQTNQYCPNARLPK